MGLLTRVSGIRPKSTGLEFKNGLMVQNMKEIGRKTGLMVTESSGI
jgi:hypothetical protein